MIYRQFTLSLVLTALLVQTPSPVAAEPGATGAAAENPISSSPATPSAETPTPAAVVPVASILPESSQPKEVPRGEPTPLTVEEIRRRNLSTLTGKREIFVQSDLDDHFFASLATFGTPHDSPPRAEQHSTLDESIRVGREFNRDSLAALARTEQAEAQSGQARALLLPSVTLRISGGQETSRPSVNFDEATGQLLPSDRHSRIDTSISVKQPLFDLPGILDWQRRKIVETARTHNYRVSDGDTYAAVVGAYLNLVSSHLQSDLTKEFEQQLDELLGYIEKRAGAGASSISDMARVRARNQATLSTRLEQESASAAAGIDFVRLTNLSPKVVRLPTLADVGGERLPPTFTEAVAIAMTENPDIAALRAEIDAARVDTLATEGRFLPRLDAEFTDSQSVHAGGEPDPAGQRDTRLMLVLSWSLFNGGGDYLAHAERSARHKELLYRLDDQRRRTAQALLSGFSTLVTTRERIVSGYRELESITTATEAMSKRMLSGNQSLLDLLDVYDRHYQVRSRLVALHILEINTTAQLVRLTFGTPEAPRNRDAAPTATGRPAGVPEPQATSTTQSEGT